MNESALKIMREIKLSSVRQQLYDILGRMHVATAPETVANEVIRLFGGHDVWNTLSPSRRRDLAKVAATVWSSLVHQYVDVMRHRPMASETMVAEAMLAVRKTE